ncbi:MAG TPA: heat-inducible transcriptional repressor HrcA, partial [Alphaproteobacteria bacterium]|nr:heat-inducible transcriptional repressor HrcA [Alphaproteobacteria bacterium]
LAPAYGDWGIVKLAGRTLKDVQDTILRDIATGQSQLDAITQKLVRDGLALPPEKLEGHIIVRGQSRLLQDVKAIADLERARALMSYLEEQENMLKILDRVSEAQGVQIYIGTENQIFDQSGWSLVISPYRGAQEKIIGAIGVIGPTRLDYDRIIPMVDYTSKVITKLVEEI